MNEPVNEEMNAVAQDLESGPQTSLNSSCLVRWALSKSRLLLGPQFLQHNQWVSEGAQTLFNPPRLPSLQQP